MFPPHTLLSNFKPILHHIPKVKNKKYLHLKLKDSTKERISTKREREREEILGDEDGEEDNHGDRVPEEVEEEDEECNERVVNAILMGLSP